MTICGSHRACLRISDHCRVTVRVRAGLGLGLGFGLGLGRGLGRVADCCIQTAGESDKMRINHVTETDQWRAAPADPSRPALCRVAACI